MRLFKVKSVKKMMSGLLINNVFDEFLLNSLKLTTMVEYEIDGTYNKLWGDYDNQYIRWKDIKPMVYELIKGNKTPTRIKAIMIAPINNMLGGIESGLPSEQDGYVLNIKYENDELAITSAVSYKTFSLDRSKEKAWDDKVEKLLINNDIEFETL